MLLDEVCRDPNHLFERCFGGFDPGVRGWRSTIWIGLCRGGCGVVVDRVIDACFDLMETFAILGGLFRAGFTLLLEFGFKIGQL